MNATSADLVAQVILRPAVGPPHRAPTTTTNLQAALPDPAAARLVQDHFRRAGLEVGPVFATSFSLVGPLDSFVIAFAGSAAELEPILRGRGVRTELDLAHLPGEVRRAIEAVVVTSPPDFGPAAP